MGLRSRLIRWIAKDEGVRLAIADELKSELNGFLKNEVVGILEDEEIGQAVVSYGDALYDRYQKKFWGQIGGIQKGLNYLPKNENGQNSIISNILDGEEISLSNIIKSFLSSGFKGTKSNVMTMGSMT